MNILSFFLLILSWIILDNCRNCRSTNSVNKERQSSKYGIHNRIYNSYQQCVKLIKYVLFEWASFLPVSLLIWFLTSCTVYVNLSNGWIIQIRPLKYFSSSPCQVFFVLYVYIEATHPATDDVNTLSLFGKQTSWPNTLLDGHSQWNHWL